jgi:hypothetical protein
MGVATVDLAVLEEAEKYYSIRADLMDPKWHYRHTRRAEIESSKGKL